MVARTTHTGFAPFDAAHQDCPGHRVVGDSQRQQIAVGTGARAPAPSDSLAGQSPTFTQSDLLFGRANAHFTGPQVAGVFIL
jgi:hypothetical protein